MNSDNPMLLNRLVKQVLSSSEPSPLTNVVVVYIHHALHSSFSLLRAQIELGLAPQNTFVLHKSYSACKKVFEKIKNLGVHYQPCSPQNGLGKFSHSFIRDINLLWEKVLSCKQVTDKLIVMDHGGHALSFMPAEILQKYNVIGIEKTTAGLINASAGGLSFPIIETASCAAKRILESPLIAEAVVTKLTTLIPVHHEALACGVIGYGAIGKAVANKLSSMGHKVIVYDNQSHRLKEEKGIIFTNEVAAVVAFSDYLFGCTGQDIAKTIDLFRLCNKNKTLISCSSEDKEFLSLINYIQSVSAPPTTTQPLNDIIYQNDVGAEVRILRGGFPINFDGSGESVPHRDIELTRGLVLGSALQATRFFKNPDILKRGNRYMLDPGIQKSIVNEWIRGQPPKRFSEKIINNFQDLDWIAQNSGGLYRSFSYNPAPCMLLA